MGFAKLTVCLWRQRPLNKKDRAGWLKGHPALVGCRIKWLGVPLGLATWEGACFEQAFALAW
jgi:hypothetical protein